MKKIQLNIMLIWAIVLLALFGMNSFAMAKSNLPTVEFVSSFASGKGTALGGKKIHTLTIRDSDRKALANVKDYGAKGDGLTNDTAAIQKAVDDVYAKGGGVVLFPSGIYMVTSVKVRENITYQGDQATIKRPAMSPKWTRTFQNYPYKGKDSKPLIFKGLIIDGNSQNQGPYKKYELEHSDLMFFSGDAANSNRLKVIVEGCTICNGVSDGISVYSDVDITVSNSVIWNHPRAGLGITGGNSIVKAKKVKFGGEIDPCGPDSEIDRAGYGGSYKVDLVLEDIDCTHGFFEVALRSLSGSTIKANRVNVGIPPAGFSKVFGLGGGGDGSVEFTNSIIHTGMINARGGNGIYTPGQMKFSNCTFFATDVGAKPARIVYAFPKIIWNASGSDYTNQTISFKHCTFTALNTLDQTHPRYGLTCSPTDKTKNNRLILNDCVFTDKIDTAVTSDMGGKFIFTNTIFNVACRNIGGAQRYPLSLTGYDGAANWDVTLDNCSFNTTQYLYIYGYNTLTKNYLRQRKITITKEQNKIATHSGLAGNNYLSLGEDQVMRTITGKGAPGTLPGFKSADGTKFDQYIDTTDPANPKYYKCTNMNPFTWVQYAP